MNSTVGRCCLGRLSVIALIPFWAVWIWAFTLVPCAAESPSSVPAVPLTIVIDPGHGGGDMGAIGPTGLSEKMVNLDIAMRLASDLQPQFRVFFTRSDDYAVELSQRTATANQSKAAMLVSIHASSGFLHRNNGMGIYYYAPIKKNGTSQGSEGEPAKAQLWHKAQLRHRAASIALANSLKHSLAEIDNASAPTIHGAPLTLLEGADLPAVLVEIGHITHPATEKSLSTVEGIDRLGRALAKGIRNFAQAGDADRQPLPDAKP